MKKIVCVVSLALLNQQVYSMDYVTGALTSIVTGDALGKLASTVTSGVAAASDYCTSKKNEATFGAKKCRGTYLEKKAEEARQHKRLPSTDPHDVDAYQEKIKKAVASVYVEYLNSPLPSGLSSTREPIPVEHRGLLPHRLLAPEDPLIILHQSLNANGVLLDRGTKFQMLEAMINTEAAEDEAFQKAFDTMFAKRHARLIAMQELTKELGLPIAAIPERAPKLLAPLIPPELVAFLQEPTETDDGGGQADE